MNRTAAVMVLCAASGLAQTAPPVTPFADFEARVAEYMQIHKEVESGTGMPTTSLSAGQLQKRTTAMAEAIRAKRVGAAQGALFTPAIAGEFRRLIALSAHTRPRIRQSIRSGEKVAAKLQVNGRYPSGVPLETMPPSLLMALPALPAALDYRLVGSTLVLRDVTANLIIDILPDAMANP